MGSHHQQLQHFVVLKRPLIPVTSSLLEPSRMTRDWLWSPTGHEIWFFDRPTADTAGTWAINLKTGEKRRVALEWGRFSPSRNLITQPDNSSQSARITDRSAREHWTLDGVSEDFHFQPSETLVATTQVRVGAEHPAMRAVDILIMGLKGDHRHRIDTIIGNIAGWTHDEEIAIVGRPNLHDPTVVRIVDVSGKTQKEWPLGTRVHNFDLSPSGRFASFTTILDRTGSNGHFLIDLDSGHRTRLNTPMSLRWLPDESALIVLPIKRNDAGSFEFFYAPLPWKGPSFSLTAGLDHRILMESFDWSISPSGKMLAYRDEGWLRLRIIDWSDTSFTPL